MAPSNSYYKYPLEPLKWPIKILSLLGGPPMVPEDEGHTQFRHTRWGWFRLATYLTIMNALTL